MGDSMEADKAGNVDALEALEALILRANRFVAKVAETDSFQTSNIGVADWLALRALAKAGKQTFTSLARTLGVTRQRVKQIADSLKETGLVTVTSSGEDKRKAEVEITAEGSDTLTTLEQGLRGKLETVKGGMQPALRAGGVMLRLSRALGDGTGEGAKGGGNKGNREARKAERLAKRKSRQESGKPGKKGGGAAKDGTAKAAGRDPAVRKARKAAKTDKNAE